MTLYVPVEGKTKIIEPTDDRHRVRIASKDDITAGDGERHDIIPGKGACANATTCSAFALLNGHGVPTHFRRRSDVISFAAERLDMIPIELVYRRIATGSYCKRHPETPEGTRFDQPPFECYLKDDKRHDPRMVFHNGDWLLYKASDPEANAKPIGIIAEADLKAGGRVIDADVRSWMREVTEHVFLILEQAWASLNVWLIDLKIEAGFSTATGELLVGDVVDNDSWRIWSNGDKLQDKSKQVYRNAKIVTPEVLIEVSNNYTWVAAMAQQFTTILQRSAA